MKLTELLQNQEIIIQLVWDEQKIEFFSKVIDKDEASVYVTPYIHNGSELELNIESDNSVVCNIFTDDPVTAQRISWKGLSLATVNKDEKIVYCLKTRSYNAVSNLDDRRLHERVEVQVDGRLVDNKNGDMNITIHDISDNGISFYAPEYYEPASQQLNISFTDSIDERIFDIQALCAISRVNKENGRTFVGCRVLEGNNNYRIYELLKRLRKKSKNASRKIEDNKAEEVNNEK